MPLLSRSCVCPWQYRGALAAPNSVPRLPTIVSQSRHEESSNPTEDSSSHTRRGTNTSEAENNGGVRSARSPSNLMSRGSSLPWMSVDVIQEGVEAPM